MQQKATTTTTVGGPVECLCPPIGRRRALDAVALCAAAATLLTLSLAAQTQPPAVRFDVRAASGLVVSPVYEGWYQLDGKTYALFGYYNRNLKEVVDVPVGPNNRVEPGPPDQWQPTRFFPGRHYGIFAIPVPPDRPTTEVTWSLTTVGQTLAIPATLDQQYFVFPMREEGGPYPGNTPPVLKLDAAGQSAQGPLGTTASRTASVSQPLTLDVWVTDDGLPPTGQRERGGVVPAGSALSPRPDSLSVTWRAYRGPGRVTFSPEMPPIEQGKARTTATFHQAGDYVLHVFAIDSRSGSKCCWTNGYVKVAVADKPSGAKSTGAEP